MNQFASSSLLDTKLEVKNRLLNNFLFLYKSKGTEQSIRSLANCYGIPQTVFNIREYGNYRVDTETMLTYKFTSFINGLNFFSVGNSQIQIPWKYYGSETPNTIECTIRPSDTSDTMNLFIVENDVSDYMEVKFQPISNNLVNSYLEKKLGYFTLTSYSGSNYYSSSTSPVSIYNDELTHVSLQKSSNQTKLMIRNVNKNTDDIDISYAILTSSVCPWNFSNPAESGSVWFGKNSKNAYKLDSFVTEIKFWSSSLSDNDLNAHCKFPESLLSSTNLNSINDLLFWSSFRMPLDLTSTSPVNEAPSGLYDTSVNYIYTGFTLTDYPYNYELSNYDAIVNLPNLGVSNFSSNLTRVVNDTTSSFGNIIKLSLDNSIQDFSDSVTVLPIIGVNFSPTDLINQNIIKMFGVDNIGDLIGVPSDIYSSSFSGLETSKLIYKKYFSDNFRNINSFIDYIQSFDSTFFNTVLDFLPLRSIPAVGINIEPTILEKSKIAHVKPITEYNNIQQNIEYKQDYSLIGNSEVYYVTKSISDQYILINNTGDVNPTETSMSVGLISSSGELINPYMPLVDFESNYRIINNVRFAPSQEYSGSYNSRHIFKNNFFTTGDRRNRFIGCTNTEKTTYDLLPPILVNSVEDNTLYIESN